MELSVFLAQIRNSKKLIATTMAMTVFLAMAITLIQPLKYRSSLRLLVVQENTAAVTDTYAVMRSTDYVSKILAKVTYSTSFADKIFAANSDIDRGYFGDSAKKLSDNWQKTLDVKSINETGIIEIKAYHPNRDQAEKIARSVAGILITNNAEYHGLKDTIKIKVLDEPITTNYPVSPNIPVNFALATVAGCLLSLVIIYLNRQSLSHGVNYQFNDTNHYAPHLSQQKPVEPTDWSNYQSGQSDFSAAGYQPATPLNDTLSVNSEAQYYQPNGSIDHLLR